MKKVYLAVLMLLAVMALFPLSVKASTPIWASTVVDSYQGPMKNGQPVSDRGYPNCDPNSALGPADSTYNHHETFFSLGYGGYIVLGFPNPVSGSITVYEVTWGTFPAETADVYVSQDGMTWTYLGTADNSVGMGGNDPHPTTFALDICIMYVKIVDTTNANLHASISDAFDVDAVSGQYMCVDIDIKPGSWPNSFSVNDQGLIPVAVLGSAFFDVYCIHPESIYLGGAGVAQRGRSGKIAISYEDVNGDGIVDMMAFFDAQEVVQNPPINGVEGEYELALTGTLCDGTAIIGTDYVRVV